MQLSELWTRVLPPALWHEGDNIPWNDPAFSARMLDEHLSQAHDAASRRSARIAWHVEWIHEAVLHGHPTAILDLGCGPGLYTSRLARLGHTFSMHQGYTVPAVVTGKPVHIGGSRGRNEATARGTSIVIREAARQQGLRLGDMKVVIQGYGNAGAIAAQLLGEMGATIVAVSDSRGGIYHSGGLDPAAVLRYKGANGSVVGFPEADGVTNQELLELPCDILVPAALENQITAANASRIKARIVAEAANGPTTPEADAILYNRGVLVLPDILANAGGVTVSYFEWVQDLQDFFWTEREVNAKLEQVMVASYENVRAIAEQRKVHMRTAAYILAVQRVAEASTTRGIYP